MLEKLKIGIFFLFHLHSKDPASKGWIICFPDLLMGRLQCENLKNAKGTKMEKESGGNRFSDPIPRGRLEVTSLRLASF